MKYMVRIREDDRTANVYYHKQQDGTSAYGVEYLENEINRGLHFFNTQYEAVQSAIFYTSEGVMK